MKKLRMLGMAVVAIMMSLNFLACSDDEKADSYADLIVGVWKETGAFEDLERGRRNNRYSCYSRYVDFRIFSSKDSAFRRKDRFR